MVRLQVAAVPARRTSAELCRRAEATGADSLWAVDHLFWPHPIGEAMTTLAMAATVTRRATLGTCILQLPLRTADAVAKQATALQLLSGGRFVLGLGVGSHETEYRRAGAEFHRRGRALDDGASRLRHGLGRRTGSTPNNPVPPGSPVVRWRQPGRQAAGGPGGRRLGPSLRDSRGVRGRLGLAAPRGGGGGTGSPDTVEAAVVVFARVGDDEMRPSRARTGSRTSTGSPPRRSGATSWRGHPIRVPTLCGASSRPGPATSS